MCRQSPGPQSCGIFLLPPSGRDWACCIRIDGQVLVKQTQVLTGKKLRIVSVNATYESYTVDLSADNQTDFEIIGKVVWFGRQI
ncbi:S24 family peptidase [Burkholderia seminalis]|uniref:S24 family peptidase n=1 Tax=Burkholderia seminalis TaxID=488731 RepID=UPI00387E1837